MAQANAISTTSAPALDLFALGGYEKPATVSGADLWLEHLHLEDELEAEARGEDDEGRASANIARQVEIEDHLASTVGTDKAWLIAQVKLLRHWQCDLEWGDESERLCQKLIAGIAITLYAPTPK